MIVVDAGGDLTNSIMGELMLAHAQQSGIAGVVINGAVRDYGWIRSNSFPVYAAGVTHRGPYKHGPGEVNVPIAIDGMVIEPGDLILGDDDGSSACPLPTPRWSTPPRMPSSRAKPRRWRRSKPVRDRSWVERALKEANCEGS